MTLKLLLVAQALFAIVSALSVIVGDIQHATLFAVLHLTARSLVKDY